VPDFLKIRQTIAEIARVNFLQNLIGIRRSGFDNMEVLIFCTFLFENACSRTQNWGFGDMAPKWDAISTKPSIVTFLAERRRTMRRSSKSVHRCDLWACPTNQKRKKDNERNPTVANSLFALRRDYPRHRIEMSLGVVGGSLAIAI